MFRMFSSRFTLTGKDKKRTDLNKDTQAEFHSRVFNSPRCGHASRMFFFPIACRGEIMRHNQQWCTLMHTAQLQHGDYKQTGGGRFSENFHGMVLWPQGVGNCADTGSWGDYGQRAVLGMKCVYIHTQTHWRTHAYKHMNTQGYTHTHGYIYTQIHYTRIYTYTHNPITLIRIHTYTYGHTRIKVHTKKIIVSELCFIAIDAEFMYIKF